MSGPLDPTAHRDWLAAALAEDLAGGHDVTTAATVAAEARCVADLVPREAGVVAGLPLVEVVCDLVAPGAVEVVGLARDGDRVVAGVPVATLAGPTRAVLTAERTLLNVVCHLSGVATATSRWVDALAGTGCRVRDTRKTTPLMRALEKYAVRCGGGVNHRMSLGDEALVKDNHVLAAGGVAAAYAAVRAADPDLPVQVEVDTLAQALEAYAAGARSLLLDNMPPPVLREVVAALPDDVLLEASGGLDLADAAAVGSTGVDYVAVGALTHSARVLDLGLDLRPAPPPEV